MKYIYTSIFTLFTVFTAVAQTYVNFTINQPSQLTTDAGSGGSICPGSNINLAGTTGGGTPSYSYGWSPSTALTSTSTLNTVANPMLPITYYLTVTDGHNCTTTDSVYVNVLDCSGIETQAINTHFSTYPNPNYGTFNLVIEGLELDVKNLIKIYTMSGAIIYQRNITEDGNYSIQLPDAAKGVYMVVVESGGRFIQSQKISIQ